MEDSTFGRRNKMKKKRKAASSKDPAISLDGRSVSLKQHFLYLSEDLLL